MRNVAVIAALCWGIMLSPSFAGPREDTLAGIARCKAIPDDRRFLDCLYGAAQPLRGALGLTPAPGFQTQLVPPDPERPTPKSGEAGNTGVAGAIAKTPAAGGDLRLVSYSFDPRGHFTATLSDGSTWRQLDRDQSFADWRGPAARYYVRLRSSGNDHYLDVKGGAGPYQVERLR